MATRKVFEISFAIAGKMASSFKNTFTLTSSRIQQLKASIRDLNAQYRKGELSAEQYQTEHQRLTRQLDRTRLAQDRLNRAISKQNELTKVAFRSVRNMLTIGAGAAAIGGGMLLGSSIKKAMDFEAQLSSIQALTGLGNEEMAKMQVLALKMGAATKYSALEAAQGIEELIKAGLTPAQVQAGALEAALNLATAGGLDLATAAQIMSTSLNAYKKDAMSAAEASNILAGTANASATNVEEIQLGLAQVSSVAAGVGMTFKDTNVALGLFANNGLKGSDAGTSLKTMLMRLIPQTKQQKEAFADLGLATKEGTSAFFDANGQLKSLADIADLLRTSLKKMTQEQRLATLQVLFGTDAVRAANILYMEGAEGVKEFTKEMSKVTALEVAKKRMDNAAGAVEQFRGALETLQISALLPTLPIIKELALAAADFAEKYTPRITKSMENAVNTARSYLKTNFINNPEFQNLPDIESRIRFIIDKFGDVFNNWLNNGGQDQINQAGKKIAGILASSLDESVQVLTQPAVKLGLSIGNGILNGVIDAMKDSPLAPAIAFLAAPGTVPVKTVAAALATAVYGTNQIKKVIEAIPNDGTGIQLESNIFGYHKKDTGINRGTGDLMALEESARRNQPTVPKVPSPVPLAPSPVPLAPHATGGIFNRPHLGLVAEAGPEAIIPLNGSDRAKSIWQSAGESLGMSSRNVTYQITFAPVINGGGPEVKPILEQQQRSFFEQLKEFEHQRRRVSFSVK